MNFMHGLLCGLKQYYSDPRGGHKHHPDKGWDIITPSIEQDKLDILLQDDLTFKNGKVLEIEKYIEHYRQDIKKITFFTWHKFLYKLYPQINFIWYPVFLIDHYEDAKKNQKLLLDAFNFNEKQNKFLCLNARKRDHRDAVFIRVKNFENSIFSYTHRGIKSPMQGDWSIENFRDWNLEKSDILTCTKNLLVTAPMYNQTCFSIVTETRYNLPYDFVTEKTTQCWLALHPALYVSNRYHVTFLRDWGFDVFDDLFNHSYDNKSDSLRIKTLFENNELQLQKGIILTDDIKQRLYKNRDHYLNNFNKILPKHRLSF